MITVSETPVGMTLAMSALDGNLHVGSSLQRKMITLLVS